MNTTHPRGPLELAVAVLLDAIVAGVCLAARARRRRA